VVPHPGKDGCASKNPDCFEYHPVGKLPMRDCEMGLPNPVPPVEVIDVHLSQEFHPIRNIVVRNPGIPTEASYRMLPLP